MSRSRLALLCIAGALGLSTTPAIAASELPGWQLYANAYPTNFVPGVSEVQEVALRNATGGAFTLSIEVNGAEEKTAPITYSAPPASVQSALEALPGIGGVGGSVTVTGGPETYTVTYSGVLGDQHVASLTANGAELTGSEPTANASVKTPGASSGTIGIDVFNVGAAGSNGTITVTDHLPPSVRAKQAGSITEASQGGFFGLTPQLKPGLWDCTGNGPTPPPSVAGASVVTCTSDPVGLGSFAGGGGLPTVLVEEPANPQPAIGIAVDAVIEPNEPDHTGCSGEPSFCNRATISGGGAIEPASTEDPVTVSTSPAKPGLASADAWFSNPDGTIDRQAGSHPYTATFAFTAATTLKPEIEGLREGTVVGSELRNLQTETPPGLVGDLHNLPQCRAEELLKEACPPSSIVGTFETSSLDGIVLGRQVFNMVPAPGTPAELGIVLEATPVYLRFHVKSGSEYQIVTDADAIPAKTFFQTILTLWGSPQEASHDPWRGHPAEGGCTNEEMERVNTKTNLVDYCLRPQHPIAQPILTLPTSCGEAQPFAFRETSGWQEPNLFSEVAFSFHGANGRPEGFTGCEGLAFEPSLEIGPGTSRTDAPTSLGADVKTPLGGLESSGGLGPATVLDTKVVLPEGLVINPGQAANLGACPPGRPAPGREGDALTTPEETARGEEDDEAPNCSAASKVGTVAIKTPLLESAHETELDGNIYVLQSNPPDVHILVAASADGVNVKLRGVVHLDEHTGQVTTTFEKTPQLPFTDFKLAFDGGAKAALDTPTHCGTYAAAADFRSWATPFIANISGNPAFALVEGPGASGCPTGALPFTPSFIAGTSSNEAGSFTTFTTLLQRGDGQQRVQSYSFTSPAGLAGLISSIPPCPEPLAAAGTCPKSSQIGHTIVQSGPGSNPLTIPQPGAPEAPIYLTGGYKGAPYGLSIVTPVIAGPFDLGTIVTRAKIEVDPTTAQVTVTTDPLPPIVKGVPTDLRSIYAVIDREHFFFNPTNCEPQQFTGTATGTGPPGQNEPAQSAPLSSHFGIGGCRGLTFAPKFSASTQGNGTFNRNGASLNVKIATGEGPQTNPATPTEANIRKVEVALPVQLPSRLETLQRACTEQQFAANPAGCPEASDVGTATARTPVLPDALSGPAYLVSHGNAAFPDLVILLQGDGVKIVLTGHTDIKKGITYSRFETVPDAPVTSFELNLPERRYSALSGNELCTPKTVTRIKTRKVRRHGRRVTIKSKVTEHVAAPLPMPTTITAQNGAVVSQTTNIAVTGCYKPAPKKKAKRARRSSHRRHR